MNNKKDLPTSPHIQIYNWNVSSLTSIGHRISGIVIYLSIILISWYVVLFTYNAQYSPQQHSCDCWLTNLMGYLSCFAMVGVILALCYHFCNGIRHLFWDIGKGYDLKTARRTGFLVIFSSMLLTAVIIAMVAYFKFM